MKTYLVFLLAALYVLPTFSQSLSTFPNNELILFMSPDSDQDDLADLLNNLQMYVVEGPTPNLEAILIRMNNTPPAGNYVPITGKKAGANGNAKVTGVGFNYLVETRSNTGTNVGYCYDILDPSIHPNGGNDMVTAIFDTGISDKVRNFGTDYFDLTDIGYNAINPGRQPYDNNNHGTHMASIVMNNLENDNGAVQLKAYKTHDNLGYSSLFGIIKALDYAVADGVDIINMSFRYYAEKRHGIEPKEACRIALSRAFAISEMLLIAAAGNDDNDNDFAGINFGLSAFPASFSDPNIIAVASSNCALEKSYFSNFGAISVDVFAPGENIEGLDKIWQPLTMSGTSQATAFVTKLATYLGTHQSTFDWELTKCAILNSAIPMNLGGPTLTDGYIDSRAALSYLQNNSANCGNASNRLIQSNNQEDLKSIKYLNDQALPTFEINSEKDQFATVLISSINGQILANHEIQLLSGKNLYDFDFPFKDNNGLYIMTIKTKERTQSLKFIR